jgi:hypothetical protein
MSREGSGSICQRYGSEDPDPNQNVTDPELCLEQWFRVIYCHESHRTVLLDCIRN